MMNNRSREPEESSRLAVLRDEKPRPARTVLATTTWRRKLQNAAEIVMAAANVDKLNNENRAVRIGSAKP